MQTEWTFCPQSSRLKGTACPCGWQNVPRSGGKKDVEKGGGGEWIYIELFFCSQVQVKGQVFGPKFLSSAAFHQVCLQASVTICMRKIMKRDTKDIKGGNDIELVSYFLNVNVRKHFQKIKQKLFTHPGFSVQVQVANSFLDLWFLV